MEFDVSRLTGLLETGGTVVMVLVAASILTLAMMFYKLWQLRAARVGQHRALHEALGHWRAGERDAALAAVGRSRSYLVPLFKTALSGQAGRDQLIAMAETRFANLERGFRMLDTVAQLAPLLGLFGTVLGMIEAFQALQAAGSQVDPSVLAGGIWVALLTTAVGLAVAMPSALVLSWFEGRMERERVFAADALETLLAGRA